MKVKMTIEFEMDDSINCFGKEERLWYENEVFIGNRTLLLHSNEIGDFVGEITSVKKIKWIP